MAWQPEMPGWLLNGVQKVSWLAFAAGLSVALQAGAAGARTRSLQPNVAALSQSSWTVAVSDDFSDPSKATLPSSAAGAAVQYGYLNGEYQIAIVDPSFSGSPGASVPGLYSDSMIAVDARLVGDAGGRYVGVYCRRQPDGSQYRFVVGPGDGAMSLLRFDGARQMELAPIQSADALHSDTQSNHLTLECAGGTITALVNGVQVATAQDTTYAEGQTGIVLGRARFPRDYTADARFANLVVYVPASP